MGPLLPPWPLFAAFMAASLLLAITPGPGVIYIVTRSISHGRRHGIASVLGVAAGNLANALVAAFGLAALFAVSSLAYTAVRLAGAAYLIWLGYRMLVAAADTSAAPPPAAAPLVRVCRDGFLVAALNPKTALFFAAFLPQFLAPQGNALAQGVLLGLCFVAMAAITDSLYAIAAGSLAPVLERARLRRLGQRAGGGALIGLCLFTALSGARIGR